MNVSGVLEQLDRLYAAGNPSAVEQFLEAHLEQAVRSDPGTALTLYNEISGFYRSTGRAMLAAEQIEEALELIGQMGISGTVFHGTTLLNGATAYRMAGDRKRALEMFRQAEHIFLGQDPVNPYLMASLYNNISHLYQEFGDYEAALLNLNHAMEQIRICPDNEAEVATTRTNRALVLIVLGQWEEAEEEIRRSLDYYEGPEGASDGHYGSALSAEAELAWKQGRLPEAAESYEKALEVIRRFFGENDAYQATVRNLSLLRKEIEAQEG